MAGSFVERGWAHPALAHTHDLSSDIYPRLFHWFFTHPVFERWHQRGVRWQLHCVGDPGAGKTTLAALIVRHLEAQFQPHRLPIISVFVRQDVLTHETEFLEDFLVIVYQGLGKSEACRSNGIELDYEEYVRQCSGKPGGYRIQLRLNLIRKALYKRLQKMGTESHAFIIVDGVDRCGPGLRHTLDTELFELSQLGVHIMVTSRIATYENWRTTCDHSQHGEEFQEDFVSDDDLDFDENVSSEDESSDEADYDAELLQIFLTCRSCKKVLCFPCFEVDRICEKCQTNDHLHESYDHVNIELSVPADELKNFIAWDLEREHGDLGLRSSCNRKPPLSSLGLSLKNDHPGSALAIAEEVYGRAGRHIGLAKARLDVIHAAQSINDVRQHRYQLPSNIISMYEAAIEAIESQSSHHSDLGLKAIALAGNSPRGLPVPSMQEILNSSFSVKLRSGEDILDAARCFLIATTLDNPQIIRIFHDTFFFFVAHRYSESVHNKNTELTRNKQSNEAKIPYHEARVNAKSGVRFEPLITTEEPTAITPSKLTRTVTMMDAVNEEPSLAYILRKGTRMWR